ncbi:MAG: 3-methyl-2-oxobutanoate hydroxymethyltransferase [Candidatus Wallbacteria bacterium]|nr:3-methyl-2-oxobutanoate hydroxymethyltransferase [Candidatus Wallbacteria bacterium]
MKKTSVTDIRSLKGMRRIVALTAYDCTMAKLVASGGADILLVGDSLAQCVKGEETTLSVTLEETIYHTRNVVKGAGTALVVADLPFMSYQVSTEQGLSNAGRVMKETGCQAVKMEGGSPERCELISRCVESGIPVMGHIGLTPQSVNAFGGYVVQGRSDDEGKKIFDQALNIERAGAFSIVLECIPYQLAKNITLRVSSPTIGIGAGPYCDGQILVINDLLGMSFWEKKPRFVKVYDDIASKIIGAVSSFRDDVVNGEYPEIKHSYKGVDGENGQQD